MRPPALRLTLLVVALASGACRVAAPGPAPLDTRNETCAFCRMHVSDARFAAQLVAPGEEPRFFDDLGCLAHYLEGRREEPRGERVFVADHQTGAWVEARLAVYTLVAGLETPMGSHIIAHADVASRDADPGARGGTPLSIAEVLKDHRPAGAGP